MYHMNAGDDGVVYRQFLARDIKDIIEMYTEDNVIRAALTVTEMHMCTSKMTVKYEEREMLPIMNRVFSRDWKTMFSQALVWISAFGLVIYKVIRIKVEVNPGEEDQSHQNHWEGDDESESESDPDKTDKEDSDDDEGGDGDKKRKGKNKLPLVDTTVGLPKRRRRRTKIFEVPVEVSYDILFRAQGLYEHGRGRVVVFDEAGNEDTTYRWAGRLPDPYTMKFQSMGNALLNSYRALNKRRTYYDDVMGHNAMPAIYLQPTAQSELATSISLHGKVAKGFSMEETEDGLEIIQNSCHVHQLNPTGDLNQKLLSRKRITEKKDNIVYLPAGYQSVVSVLEPKYIGDIRKDEEDWCRIVSSLSGVLLEFLYPQITGSGKLVAGPEQMNILIGNVQLVSQRLAEVMKTIWCDIYSGDKLEKLMWCISVSSPMATENILTLFDRGALAKKQATEQLYKTHHLDPQSMEEEGVDLKRQHELDDMSARRDHAFNSQLHKRTLDSKLQHEKLKMKSQQKKKDDDSSDDDESSGDDDDSDDEEEKPKSKDKKKKKSGDESSDDKPKKKKKEKSKKKDGDKDEPKEKKKDGDKDKDDDKSKDKPKKKEKDDDDKSSDEESKDKKKKEKDDDDKSSDEESKDKKKKDKSSDDESSDEESKDKKKDDKKKKKKKD
jgi:hypothetical protein